jgi:hypothetical protein
VRLVYDEKCLQRGMNYCILPCCGTMNKVTLTVPWGHIDPIKKTIKAQFITMFFLQIIFYNISLHSNIDKKIRLCLGTFEYIEADREIYRKWITKSKQYSTTLHVRVSDYFICSIIICRFCLLLYVMLRSARHRSSEKKKKLSISNGRYCGVHLTPSGNKNKNKINGKIQKLANGCDIVRKALRKKYVKGDVSIRDSLKK